MKIPIFYAKFGVWGQYGWKPIALCCWLKGVLDDRVTKVRWVERKVYDRAKKVFGKKNKISGS